MIRALFLLILLPTLAFGQTPTKPNIVIYAKNTESEFSKIERLKQGALVKCPRVLPALDL